MNMKQQNYRKENEQPFAIAKMGMRFHHIGIPTKDIKQNEKYLEQYKFFVSGFNTSDFGIEWMRFEEESPIAEIIKKIPHIAFEVDDLDSAIIGR
jgi:catechol 2,3-dioxygenase-like lactoylglutathione lyase family enzyme